MADKLTQDEINLLASEMFKPGLHELAMLSVCFQMANTIYGEALPTKDKFVKAVELKKAMFKMYNGS